MEVQRTANLPKFALGVIMHCPLVEILAWMGHFPIFLIGLQIAHPPCNTTERQRSLLFTELSFYTKI
jgi:hypothetical protein